MNPWFETAGVALIAVLGMALGVLSRRLRRPYWATGYVLSLLVIVVLALGRTTSLHFMPPVSWVVATRTRFILIAIATTLGLTTPLSRLPRRWERVGVCLLMGALLARFALLPFLMPALIQDELAHLESTIDDNGVCLQTTRYTCGPAAAVTALLRLGLPASESQIAILSHASPAVGTLPACLSRALRRRYAGDGLRCQYRRFDSIAQLAGAGITLAIVRSAFLQDHCVAVLDVSNRTVTIADPMIGIVAVPLEEFQTMWRFCGVVLTRDPADVTPSAQRQGT